MKKEFNFKNMAKIRVTSFKEQAKNVWIFNGILIDKHRTATSFQAMHTLYRTVVWTPFDTCDYGLNGKSRSGTPWAREIWQECVRHRKEPNAVFTEKQRTQFVR